MAKLGKLTKLKSAMKKLPSFTKKLSRTTSTNSFFTAAAAAATDSVRDKNGGGGDGGSKEELHAVYVGKSRRRYYLSSDVICHPLFQELVERSGGFDDGGEAVVVVACEVVLFEHLLWMLDSSSGTQELGSMQELVEFYAC